MAAKVERVSIVQAAAPLALASPGEGAQGLAVQPAKGVFIGNRWRPAKSQKTVDVVDPSAGKVFAQIADSGPEDVDAAVAAARRAFDEGAWGRTRPTDRGRLLTKVGELIVHHAEELAQIEAKDTGKPISLARGDMVATARYFEYYGGAADKVHGDTIPYLSDFFVATVREAHGVTAHIIPWNYPAQMFGRTVAPALAMGNACVIKPAEDACLSAHRLVELIAEAGFPDGAVALVPGRGESAGAALSGHKDIDFISFTGSPEVGALIQTATAKNHIGCTLELGGKSPHVVFADANLDEALPVIGKGIVMNAGQTCSAGSRVLVERSVYDKVAAGLAAYFARMRAGTPAMDMDLGPVVNASQKKRVESFRARAKADGIPLLAEGSIAAGVDPAGYFVTPSLYGPVPHDNDLACEEVFGPLLVLIPFGDEADAVRLANDTDYGLMAAVWTGDGSRALRVARRIRAGQVYINGFGAGGGIELPFGGMKKSGHGREKGLEALLEFSTLKTIILRHG